MQRPDRRLWPQFCVVMLAGDLVAIALGLTSAWHFGASAEVSVQPVLETYGSALLVAIGAGWEGALVSAGLYRRANLVSGISEYRRIVTAGAATTAGVVLTAYSGQSSIIPRGFVLIAFGFVTVLVCMERFLIRRLIYQAARRGHRLERVVVVGTSRQAVSVALQLRAHPGASAEVVGFLSEYEPVGAEVVAGLRVLGEPLQLADIATRFDITRALVIEAALSWESRDGVVRLMNALPQLEVAMVPGLHAFHSLQVLARQLGPVLTLVPRTTRIVGLDAALKRAFDILVAGLALMLSLPLLGAWVVVSLLRNGTPGFRAERCVGPRGEFDVWVLSARPWTRRAHLSRLPTLALVLSGRMSLLGPRPVPVDRAAEYAWAMPYLWSARSGFIGPWWLVGGSRPAAVEEELVYDVHYLRNYSIWLDIQILGHVARRLVGIPTGAALRAMRATAATEVTGKAELPQAVEGRL